MKKTFVSLIIAQFFLLSLMLQACDKSPHKSLQSGDMISGKAKAPVNISSELIGSQLKVDITFLSDISGLSVKFSGIDGLKVVDQTSSSSATFFNSGDTITYILNVEQPTGMSYVSVEISGIFNGVKRASVQAISIGKITDDQVKKRSENIKNELGDNLHVLPAEEE